MPTAEQNVAILEHQNATLALANAKADEAAKRQKVCDMFFPNGHVPKGTNNIDLGGGYTLQIVGKLNFTVDSEAVPKVKATLAAAGEIAAYIGNQLFKTKYDLSVTEYNKLSPELLPLVLPAITSKPGTPTVEVVAPKAK